MSREITVKQAQNIIQDIQTWSESAICPAWAITLLKAIADTLEYILSNREA